MPDVVITRSCAGALTHDGYDGLLVKGYGVGQGVAVNELFPEG